MKLRMALGRKDEPSDDTVVVTADGRSLTVLADRSYGLDTGDAPTHWTAERAASLAARWNRDNSQANQVSPVYWRDHYAAQVERLTAQMKRSTS